MSVKGFDLILNYYCAYCSNFSPEVEKVNMGNCESPHRTLTEIRCENETSCAVIAQNLVDRMRENGKTDA